MKGNDQTRSAQTLEPVVCEEPGMCAGCSDWTQFAVHVDIGVVDATLFVCWRCLMRLGREMDSVRKACETQETPDA